VFRQQISLSNSEYNELNILQYIDFKDIWDKYSVNVSEAIVVFYKNFLNLKILKRNKILQ